MPEKGDMCIGFARMVPKCFTLIAGRFEFHSAYSISKYLSVTVTLADWAKVAFRPFPPTISNLALGRFLLLLFSSTVNIFHFEDATGTLKNGPG
jgi:hypothetical protein